MHFLFVGGELKSQHSTPLQYILFINENIDSINPIGAAIFLAKNIVWGQGYTNPIMKEDNKVANEIKLKIVIQFNNCKIVNL